MIRLPGAVSLRLFGSEHVKTRVFSHVLGPAGLLDEDASWTAFAEHFRRGAIPADRLVAAGATLARDFEAAP